MAALTHRPEALPVQYELKTLDDVDAALHELGWCSHKGAALDAECKAAVEKVKEVYLGRHAIKIGETETTLEARAAELEQAIEKWGAKQLTKHLPKGSKTLKLPHGELSFKLQPLAVAFVEGTTEKAVVSAIDKKTKLLQLAAGLLAKITLGAFDLTQLVRLTPSLDKDGIKKLWEQEPKRRGTLKGLGINVTGGSDAVVVSPAKVTVSPA